MLLSVVGAIPTLTSAANVDLGQLLVHRAIQFFFIEIARNMLQINW